jgi:CYTH domain-containing protein
MKMEQGMVEIERTFLARSLSRNLQEIKPIHMVDVYIPADLTVHARLRLRRSDACFEITKKFQEIAGDAGRQIECTIPLTEVEYNSLVDSQYRRVEKLRYKIQINNYVAEIDVFSGKLSGLVLIEFEFALLDALRSFVPPEICGADVTQDDFIAGGMLAGRSYTDIRPRLLSLGYKPPQFD